jgi:hypothetical protein
MMIDILQKLKIQFIVILDLKSINMASEYHKRAIERITPEQRAETVKFLEKLYTDTKNIQIGVELYCMICKEKYFGPEPIRCCDGRQCGCMGLPIEPFICSRVCYEKLLKHGIHRSNT